MFCCQVRKVRPLVKALEGLDAWFTGLRRDQWASRAAIKKVELDHDHDAIVKVNALADWEGNEVDAYIKENDVPVHPLYAQGYTSIGCAPCTRAIQPGENSRAGRWWWETDAPKECGIHCTIETGSFEHEAEAILSEASARLRPSVMNSYTAGGAGLTLNREEADAVAAAASGYAAVLPPGRAEAYHALAQAAADGVIPDELVDAAERVAAVSLQTGRARREGQRRREPPGRGVPAHPGWPGAGRPGPRSQPGA